MTALRCEFFLHIGISVIRPLTSTSDPGERPTAETLLRAPFCISDPHYNFLDTDLYAKIRDAF